MFDEPIFQFQLRTIQIVDLRLVLVRSVVTPSYRVMKSVFEEMSNHEVTSCINHITCKTNTILTFSMIHSYQQKNEVFFNHWCNLAAAAVAAANTLMSWDI